MCEYNFLKEKERYNFADITANGMSLNRGTCVPEGCKDSILRTHPDIEKEIIDSLFPTTLSKKSSLIDISQPYAGHYYCYNGKIFFDADIGVAQKLIDDQHPEIKKMLNRLLSHNALVRRESITNDVMVVSNNSEIKTPQDLSNLITGIANAAFPSCAPYKSYFSSSGALAVEAAMKIACRYAHHSIIEKYGYEFEKGMMEDFGIPYDETFNHPEDKDPIYQDYPFFFIAMKGAFHGRSMGALSLTNFRPVQKRGFPQLTRVKHITFNGDANELVNLIDTRSLSEIVDNKEKITGIIASGKIPRELIAGIVIEPFQGEAGYIIAQKDWIESVVKTCKDNDICVIADEVQSFARTGRPFAAEHYDIDPDIITISKASIVSTTIASAKFTKCLPKGWHSNTWGGGKVFDNNLAWTIINTYMNYKDPVFEGHTYVENQRLKESYIRQNFEILAKKHPGAIISYSGLGTMWSFSIKNRSQVCLTGIENGLKLLTCGITNDVSAIRALFLADVLTKEIDDFFMLLDKTLTEIEKNKEI